MQKIKLLIIDDHAIVRQGLRTFLELTDEFEIIGEGSTGKDAIRLSAELKPDVVLLDLMMPEMNGVEATHQIMHAHPDMKILILSSFSDNDDVFAAIRAGAKGYVLKDIPPDELADALREVYKGKAQLHPEIAQKLMQHIQTPEADKNEPNSLAGDLTERELEVLQHIGRGLSNKEIASKLSISHKTVKTHVSNLLSKLHLSDRTQAAIFAIRQGLLPDED